MDNKNLWKVYRYWIDLDGREWSYIGYTSQSLYDRAGGLTGINYLLQCPKFGFAIETYGWDNFKREILEDNLTEEEALEKEQQYIHSYNSIQAGFNVSRGGRGNNGISWSGLIKEKNSNGHNRFKKAVLQYDLTGSFIKEYESIHEAARQLNIDPRNILICCQGKRKTTHNYTFKFKDA